MNLTRRAFLASTAVGITSFALGFPRRARAAGGEPALVFLFLRGGADGLGLLVPHGDARYYDLRPTIQVPAGSELDLDGFYGLNPGLADLLPLFQDGHLAAIHAAGSPDPTRSHFDAQDYAERAAPGDKSVRDGWLQRALVSAGPLDAIASITLGNARAASLVGSGPSVAMPSLQRFALEGAHRSERGNALEAHYTVAQPGGLERAAEETFETLVALAGAPIGASVPYPNTHLAIALRDAASLIKADIGVRVVAVDFGDWDTHSDEVKLIGVQTATLGEALAAFHADLGAHANRTLLLAMTEFGRTAAENGAKGTDHGRASVIWALGAGIAGGRVLTRDGWPGLGPAELEDGRDLAVTTDFRDVFAEVLDRHLGIADLGPALPGFSSNAGNYPGLFV